MIQQGPGRLAQVSKAILHVILQLLYGGVHGVYGVNIIAPIDHQLSLEGSYMKVFGYAIPTSVGHF